MSSFIVQGIVNEEVQPPDTGPGASLALYAFGNEIAPLPKGRVRIEGSPGGVHHLLYAENDALAVDYGGQFALCHLGLTSDLTIGGTTVAVRGVFSWDGKKGLATWEVAGVDEQGNPVRWASSASGHPTVNRFPKPAPAT